MLDPIASISPLLMFGASLLATGVIAGLLAGLLGVGGGIVIVPTMCYLLDTLSVAPATSMHMAVGTSLASIIPTSISSLRAHHAKGVIDAALLRQWWLPILVGSAVGAAIAGLVDGVVLALIFATVALVVAGNIFVSKAGFSLAAQLPPQLSVNLGIGGLIGSVSALMGIGGGTLSVPILCLFRYPIHRAVGTASALGLLIAVPAVVGYALSGLGVPDRPAGSVGYVNLFGVAAIVPMTVLMAPVGARLAHRLDAAWLKRAFAVFLAITALRMYWRALV